MNTYLISILRWISLASPSAPVQRWALRWFFYFDDRRVAWRTIRWHHDDTRPSSDRAAEDVGNLMFELGFHPKDVRIVRYCDHTEVQVCCNWLDFQSANEAL